MEQSEDAANSGSLPAGSPHVSSPSVKVEDKPNTNDILSKTDSEKTTTKPSYSLAQEIDPLDFSSVNIVNNPDEELELFNLKVRQVLLLSCPLSCFQSNSHF